MPSAVRMRGSGLCLDFSILRDHVGRRFGGHALERHQLIERQPVDIRHAVHQAAIHQLIHQRVAQAVDIHHAARREMQDGLLQPRRAVDVDAARCGFALFAHDLAAAHGARFRHAEGLAVRALRLHPHHLGNHIAAALDHHRVADLQAQPLDFVFVVQGGARNRHAAHLHRFQVRHRRQRAGAPHLHFDARPRWSAPAAPDICRRWPSAGLWRCSQAAAAARWNPPSPPRRRSRRATARAWLPIPRRTAAPRPHPGRACGGGSP